MTINQLNLNPQEAQNYMMLEEASALYDIPKNTIRDWIKLDKIKYIKVRGRVMVSKADLDFISRLYVPKVTRRKVTCQ